MLRACVCVLIITKHKANLFYLFNCSSVVSFGLETWISLFYFYFNVCRGFCAHKRTHSFNISLRFTQTRMASKSTNNHKELFLKISIGYLQATDFKTIILT